MKSCQLPVVSCQQKCGSLARPRLHWQLATNNWQLPSAFTLTELLVVISLIVLILAMAVPAFNLISGSGSIDQAQNQIGAMLSQAQATAITRENYVGVLFYKDALQDRTVLALVEKVKPKPWVYQRPSPAGGMVAVQYRRGDVVSRVTNLTAEPSGMQGEPLGIMTRYYIANIDHAATAGNGPAAAGGINTQWTLIKPFTIDLVRDGPESPGEAPRFRERQQLPKNVQVQFPFEPERWSVGKKYYRDQRVVVPTGDPTAPPTVYACREEHISTLVPTPGNKPPNGTFWVTDPNIEKYMGVGLVMFDPTGKPVADSRGGFNVEFRSELGAVLGMVQTQPFPYLYARTDFVMFDQEAFRGAGHNDEDPMISGNAQSAGAEDAEEQWLDDNGLLLIVDRYRGTLGRAE